MRDGRAFQPSQMCASNRNFLMVKTNFIAEYYQMNRCLTCHGTQCRCSSVPPRSRAVDVVNLSEAFQSVVRATRQMSMLSMISSTAELIQTTSTPKAGPLFSMERQAATSTW
jgi:hypothetical protein